MNDATKIENTEEYKNFSTTTTCRLAIVLNGLKLRNPTLDQISEISVIVSADDPTTNPFCMQWNLYQLNEDGCCPLHRLSMAPWLVNGVCIATGNNQFDFASIDPTEWLKGMNETLDSLPVHMVTAPVRRLLEVLRFGADSNPDDLEIIRQELKGKAAAIAELDNERDSLGELLKGMPNVTVIRLN